MADDFINSHYRILRAKLSRHGGSSGRELDIANLITEVHFNQSIDSVGYKGIIKVLDGMGVLEKMPLRGEETIDFSIETYDTNTIVELKLRIFKIDGIETANNRAMTSYNLHVCSHTTFEASKRRVTSHFSGTTEKIAKKIFEDYFGKIGSAKYLDENKTLPYATRYHKLVDERDRRFYIQPGASILNFIIPRYIPTKAMEFLANRSYQPETASHTFRFFENWVGFYFVTDEFLLDRESSDPIKLFYSPDGSIDPSKPNAQLGRIDTLSNPSRGSHSTNDIFNGKYYSSVYEVDIIKRKTVLKEFDYLKDGSSFIDGTGQTRKISNMPYTSDFVKDTFTKENGKRHLVIRDYQEAGDAPSTLKGEQHFAEIAMRRASYSAHLNDMVVNAQLKGRSDITPGRVVELDIAGFTTDAGSDHEQLAGKYLVHSTIHAFARDQLVTQLRLVKYDWSTK